VVRLLPRRPIIPTGSKSGTVANTGPTDRQNSWESHTSFSSSNQAAEKSKRIVGLLYQLLQDVIKEVLLNAALIVVRLCPRWVCTSWVDPLADHAMDIIYHFGLNLWWGRTKIWVKRTKYICACSFNPVINVPCITIMLCSTSWTKLQWDPKLACVLGQQTMVDGRCGEGNECWVDFINQWSIFHSHLSYAIEVCPVNKIHNFSRCKSNLALLNWSSRQPLNKKGTLNLPHKRLWGM